MYRNFNQVSLALVTFLLGALVVVQLRSQAGSPGLAALSAQELTVLVANLNTRNEQLRTEVATLERQLDALVSGQARGETSVDRIRTDLGRVQAWAGLQPVTGPGITVLVSGPVTPGQIGTLFNELRNAGAEAISISGIRVVPGTIIGGDVGAILVGGVRADGLNRIDANIQRDFRLSERFTLQLRMDALNAANRSQFEAPNRDPISTNFGRVTNNTSSTMRFLLFQVRIKF